MLKSLLGHAFKTLNSQPSYLANPLQDPHATKTSKQAADERDFKIIHPLSVHIMHAYERSRCSTRPSSPAIQDVPLVKIMKSVKPHSLSPTRSHTLAILIVRTPCESVVEVVCCEERREARKYWKFVLSTHTVLCAN